MPTTMKAKERMKEAVNQALADGNSFLANEITANVMAGTTMQDCSLPAGQVFTIPKAVF